MKNRLSILSLCVAAALLCAAPILAADSTKSPVKVAVPSKVQAKAKMPAPPATAKKAASVGKGKAMVKTANAAGDTDSMWSEEIDIDGDGDVEETDLLWDDEDKVLFLYADGTFTCADGSSGDGGMAMAVYGQGNAQKKPAGSGWYAVELDEDECAAEAAGLFGCRFDAQGNATACGMVAIDDANDDIAIVGAED